MLRAGVTADAAALVLLAVCLTARDPASHQRYVPLLAVLKIYCTYAAAALVAAAGVCCARGPRTRAAAAVAVSAVLLAALATPFWTDGMLSRAARTDQGGRTALLAREALAVNPFYAVTSAVSGRVHFVWHEESPLLYGHTALGAREVAAPPVSWYDAPLRLAGLAALLAAVSLARAIASRGRSPGGGRTGEPPAPGD
jgi:hypothetical protein